MLIFLILTLILAVIYAGFSIMKTSEKMTSAINSANDFGVKIRSLKSETFNAESFESVGNELGVEKIFQYEGVAELKNGKVVTGEQMVMREDLPGYLGNTVMLQAISDVWKDPLFRSEVFKVIEGKNTAREETGKVLVHEALAKKNQWKVGDKVSLKVLGEEKELELLIQGIFTGKKQEKYTGMSSDFSENMMFTDYTTMVQIFGKKKLVTSLKILVSDSEKLAALKTELNKKSVQPDDYEVVEEENQFSEMVESLNMVRQMIFTMIMAVIGAGIIVLSLVLILWVRERMYEIGILLAIGCSKMKIMGQFILELVLTSLPAMILAAMLGRIFVGWILGAILQKEGLDNLDLSSFMISGGGLDIFAMSYGLLILIIVLAVIAASWMILVKKPKEILAKIS
jgi:transmembrane protein vexp1